MAELFGFSFRDREKKAKNAPSPIAPTNEDGATSFIAGGYYGQYVDLDGNFKTEYDMVKKYRVMAMHPEVDSALRILFKRQSLLIRTIHLYKSAL